MNRKPIFDVVRHLIGRGLQQGEVDQIDNALDQAADASVSGSEPPVLTIADAGTNLIKQFEGCALRRNDGQFEAYPDPATGGAPWTIGWGATGGDITPETVWTQQQCDARLARDLQRFSAQVRAALGSAATTQMQFDALVCFHYNTGAVARATLTKRHIAGDYVGAAREFTRWNRAGGRVLAGLTRRRAAEARLYASTGKAQ